MCNSLDLATFSSVHAPHVQTHANSPSTMQGKSLTKTVLISPNIALCIGIYQLSVKEQMWVALLYPMVFPYLPTVCIALPSKTMRVI